MHPCDERQSALDLMSDESDVEEDCSRHFQEFYFPGFTMVVTFNHKGTKCPLVLCQIRLSVFLLLLQLSQTWKQNIIYPLPTHHPVFTQHDCPFSLRRRGVCLDWLLLVEVSKHMPACRLLLLVHHKEKWRKRLDREWTEQSISAVITLTFLAVALPGLLGPGLVRSSRV